MNEAKWQLIKSSYIAGHGSLRQLAKQYSVSESTTMKRAAREHWTASARLNRSKVESEVTATMQQRAAGFVSRMADQSDSFLAKVAESGELLEPTDRQGLKQLTSALKDVSAVGRDTFQLGNRDDEQSRCIVNLGFLQSYVPETCAVVTDEAKE